MKELLIKDPCSNFAIRWRLLLTFMLDFKREAMQACTPARGIGNLSVPQQPIPLIILLWGRRFSLLMPCVHFRIRGLYC